MLGIVMITKATIHPETIRTSLRRILSTMPFANSKILSDFLQFIVNESLEGREEFIKEYVIATEVLKKEPDFDPQLSAIVRIHARRLRKGLENYYQENGHNDQVRIQVPKGTYKPVFEESALLVASDDSKQTLSTRCRHEKPTIVVLPFRCLNSEKEFEMLTSVFSYDLRVALTNYKEFKVVSNHSSEEAFAHHQSFTSINEQLDADYLINGSCVWMGQKLKVTVELISTQEMEQVWAESYNLDGSDTEVYETIPNIVDKVTSKIAGFYGLIYRDFIDRNAFDIKKDFSYIYAVYWYNKYQRDFSLEAFTEALQNAYIAHEKNPENIFILTLLSELNLNLSMVDHGMDYDPYLKGLEFVSLANQLDPNFQYVHKQYAWAAILDHNKSEFLRAAEKCIACNPNNLTMKGVMGFGHICVGNYDTGYKLQSEAYELDPYAPWYFCLGFSLYYVNTGNYNEALYWAYNCNRPNFHWDPLMRASIHGLLSQKDKAQDAVNEIHKLCPNLTTDTQEIVSKFLLDDDLTRILIAGLVKAGAIEPSPSFT